MTHAFKNMIKNNSEFGTTLLMGFLEKLDN
jgi:hypothetical protein